MDFLGKKNYFNSKTQKCEIVPICKNNEEYNYETNSCRIPFDDYIENLPKFNSSDFNNKYEIKDQNLIQEENKIKSVNKQNKIK